MSFDSVAYSGRPTGAPATAATAADIIILIRLSATSLCGGEVFWSDHRCTGGGRHYHTRPWHMAHGQQTDGSEYTSIAEVHLKIVEPMSQVLLSKLRRTSVKNSPPYL